MFLLSATPNTLSVLHQEPDFKELTGQDLLEVAAAAAPFKDVFEATLALHTGQEGRLTLTPVLREGDTLLVGKLTCLSDPVQNPINMDPLKPGFAPNPATSYLLETALKTTVAQKRLNRELLETICQSDNLSWVAEQATRQVGQFFGADRCLMYRYKDLDNPFDVDLFAQYVGPGITPVSSATVHANSPV